MRQQNLTSFCPETELVLPVSTSRQKILMRLKQLSFVRKLENGLSILGRDLLLFMQRRVWVYKKTKVLPRLPQPQESFHSWQSPSFQLLCIRRSPQLKPGGLCLNIRLRFKMRTTSNELFLPCVQMTGSDSLLDIERRLGVIKFFPT